MSRFDIRRARNAPFDPEIDRELMALTRYITDEHFPCLQDHRGLHPGQPDPHGHRLALVRESLNAARPRLNLMVQMLLPLAGATGADVGPGWGFLDVLLVERYALKVVCAEHPDNLAAYSGLLKARGIEVRPWRLGREPCPFDIESTDFVIFGEVLEHLKLPPLRALREVTAPLRIGGTLLLTTPNIARQSNIELLRRGVNILEPFREDTPPDRDVTDLVDHIREYTPQEVVDLVESSGLRVTDLAMCNLMGHELHPTPLFNHYTCLTAIKE